MDKETIVMALENCIGAGPCEGCPFDASIPGYTNFPDCMVSLQKEALSLIRGLTEGTVLKEALLEGLPFKEEIYDTVYECRKCGHRTIGVSRFCEHCGLAVKAVLSTELMKEVYIERT